MRCQFRDPIKTLLSFHLAKKKFHKSFAPKKQSLHTYIYISYFILLLGKSFGQRESLESP